MLFAFRDPDQDSIRAAEAILEIIRCPWPLRACPRALHRTDRDVGRRGRGSRTTSHNQQLLMSVLFV